MVSKNNTYQKLCQDADRTPHYGLRKLSVGVASVLLSTTLYLGVNAQADTLTQSASDSVTPPQAVAVNPTAGSSATTDALATTSTASSEPNKAETNTSNVPATDAGSETTTTPTNATSASSTVSQAAKPLVLMAQSTPTSTATTDPTASVAQGIKDTGVGGTFNNVPQYTAKSSSIEFGGTNFTKISNNYTVTLSREASFEFSVKGKFTLDGNQIKKDRQILLGTILFTNNYYTDPNNAAHNQHMFPSYGGQITVTSSNGKELGYAELTYANAAEADWILHVTSDETWVDDVNINLNIPLAGYVGYFTDTAVYKNVTADKPWVETIQTPNNIYKLTYTLPNFTGGWREYQNSVGRDKSSIYFTKIAPALQTNEKYPSATLQNTLGKEGPADAKFGNYKYVIKISGLGTPILAKPGVGFESLFYPVDQNNHVIAELIGYYDNIYGTSTKLADNLTAQQLYDQVGIHQTLYSAQDDGSILIATEITPADIHLSDDRIIRELQHGSMLYATASPENQQKIIENTLAFYHGVLKNTPLLTRTYFRVDDGNGFKDAIIDSTIQDVTPLSSGRTPVPDPRYYKVGAPSASASGDLLQHKYVYYIDGAEGNKVVSTTDLAGKTGDTKTITVTIPTGYVLDQARTGTTPPSYVLKDGNNTPIYIYLKHATIQVTPDQPKTTNDKLPDNPTKSYPAGVTETDLNKTVTRTINVVNPHTSKTTTATQPAKLSRTATVDEVTGAVKYGEWTPGQWVAFVPDAIAGYTPSVTQVETTPVSGATKDATVTITYVANPQSTQIIYVDDDASGQQVKTTALSGKTDQTVATNITAPTNYVLVNPSNNPTNYTFKAANNTPITVHVKHATQDVSATDAQAKVVRDYKVQMKYPHPDGSNKYGTDGVVFDWPLTLTRTATKDLATGKVTYGPWTGDDKSQGVWEKRNGVSSNTVEPSLGLGSVPLPDLKGYDIFFDYQNQSMSYGKYGFAFGNNLYHFGQNGRLSFTPFSATYTNFRTSGGSPSWTRANSNLNFDPQTGNGVYRGFRIDFEAADPNGTDNTHWNSYITYDELNQLPASQTFTIRYVPAQQTSRVDYKDTQSGTIVHQTQLSGVTDQTINVANEVPAGYHLASGAQVPTKYTFSGESNPTVTVNLVHATTTVTPDAPKTTADKLPDNPTKTYPSGVAKDDLNKTITRTINVTDPHTQKVATTTQPVHLTRTADVDEVSGAVTYGKWTTGEWSTFNTPVVAGYTPSQANVAKATVTDTTQDQTVKITYTANPQSTTVNYVDQSGKTIHTTPVKGVTDQTVQIPSEVPAGWKLVDGQTVPKEVTFGPDGYPAVTVKIEHGHVTVTPDQPKTPSDKLPDNPTKPYPSGVSQNDLNKTITRTINVTDPHTQKVTTTTQTAHLTRSATVDEVTGDVNYTNWTTGQWDSFTPSPIAGYTPSSPRVAATVVTDQSKDTKVDITYTANPQIMQIVYVDHDQPATVVKTQTISGVTDQLVSVPNVIPVGWELTPGQKVPSGISFGPQGHDNLVIEIQHRHVTVTPDQPKTPADAFPDNPAEHYPTGVAKDDLNKTITRKINVTDPHTQKVTTTTQTVHLTRTADVDEVNGAVVYGKWTTGTWDSFIPSPVAGYTPSVKAVNAVTVVDTTADQTVSITYTANPQTTQIEYVAPDDQIVHTTPIAGTTDQTVDVPNELPAGWRLSDGQTIPTHLTFGPDGHPVVKVLIEHGHVTVTPDSPKTPSDTLADNPAAHYPTGVGADDLNKTITRTINVTDPHTQKVTTTTQTVHLTRTADVDEVTGDVEYSDWTTGEWAAFTTPKVAGYTPSVSQVAKITVTDQTKDTTVDIKYTANSHSTTVNYVDGNGEVIHATKLTGTTDQTISVPNEVPAGWQLVGDEAIPTELTFTPDGYPDTTVKIEHSHVTVTPDSPKTPSDTLPNNPSKPYPSGVAKDDLNKTITRTINVVDPHTQKMTTTTQIVHLTRTADIDEVTGDVKYSDWTTGEWAIFQVPTIAGYTPSASQVTKVAVTDQTKDTTVTIKYTANTQSTTVNYVDGDGTVVHTTKLTGTTDQTIPVPNEVPAGWQLVDNETIPTELTFTPNGYPTITVKVEHRHVTVTPNNPKTPSDTLPNNPTKPYPSGVAKDDLNKTITRTINVVDPHTQKVATTTQTVHLTRTADVDEVTGDVEYGAWTTGNWAAFTTPTVAGYTPSTPQVAATKVTAQTPDATVTITYTADTQSTVVNYVDGNGDIVHTTKLTGTTDETIPVPNEVPAGWQLVGNETIPTEITFTPDGYPTLTVKVQHSHVTVTPDQPKTPSDTLPNNPTKHYPTGLTTDDLNKTITRTIKVVDPHTQKVTTTTQSVHLTRTADVDQVTGDVEYSAWTTGNWAAFTAPAVAGYTPAVPEVAAMTVDAQTKDAIITITYTADQHTTHVNYVAGDGTVIHTTTLTGHTDETVTVPNELPAGWKLVDSQTIPDHLTMTATGHADLKVSITHAQTTVTPDAPKTPADMLPDNPTKGYPTGVAKNDLNKTVIRTINLINPISGHTTTIKQTATLTRNATIDEVTGAVTYSAWSTDHWPAFQVPDIAGYQPSQGTVAKTTVEGTTLNQTVTITYQAQTQTIHVVLIDGDQILADVPLTGPTGTKVQIPLTSVDQSKYEIVGDVPHEHVMVANDDTIITIHLAHRTQTTVETRTVTRTINLTLPGGTTVTIPQVATLERSKTTDLATGQVTYGPWSTGHWDAYQAPSQAGYTAAPAEITAKVVTADMQDQTITIVYRVTAKPQTTKSVAPEMTTPVAPVASKPTTQQQLPQTGDDEQTAMLLAGLALGTAQLSLLGIRNRKKQRN